MISSIDETLEKKRVSGASYHLIKKIGAGAHGDVYIANSSSKKFAVKLYRKSTIKPTHRNLTSTQASRYSHAIHIVLGDLGLAPKFHGYLYSDEILRMKGMTLTGPNSYDYGVVYEFIPNAKSLKKKPVRLPTNKKALEESAKKFARVLVELKIMPNDLDFLVRTDTGQIYINDLDLFCWLGGPTEPRCNKHLGKIGKMDSETVYKLHLESIKKLFLKKINLLKLSK